MKILSDEKTKIKRIYHISDIHIRLNSRKTEYEYVFDKLYKFLKNNSSKEDIIVITGDILHSKIELQPECIIMTYQFLKTLSCILPTFFIAGNHDALLNNRQRIDSLTSILNEHETKNLFYLKNTDKYLYKNIIFIVNSILDDEEWIIGEKNINKDICQIGLYHGSILGWNNADGFQMTSHADKKMEDFKNMDLVLLGDIHKFQYMDINEKKIAYAGSLISQNYGETDIYHGILEWNLSTKESKFHIIENPYRHEKIIVRKMIENDWIVYHSIIEKEIELKKCDIAKNGNLLIYLEKELEDNEINAFIKKKYPNVKCQWKRNYISNVYNDNENATQFIHELDHINNYLESHIKCKNIKEYVYEAIEKKCRENRTREQKEWKICSVRFQNLFGYLGEVNELKISDWKGKAVIGIFGKNSSGKSSLLDIICFLLFSKISRHTTNSIPKEILNFEAKKGFGEIIFEMNNQQQYVIHKTFQRNKQGKIKIDEKLFQMNNNGEKIELTEEQRRKTDKKIHEWIGEFRMFLFSNMYVQQGEISFRNLKPTERKDFLYKMFDLDIFSIIKKEKEDELKELLLQLSILRSKIGNNDLEETSNELNKKKQVFLSSIQDIELNISNLYNEILDIQRQIIHIPYSSIKEIQEKEDKLQKELDIWNNKIANYKHNIDLEIPLNINSILIYKYSPIHSDCKREQFDYEYKKYLDYEENKVSVIKEQIEQQFEKNIFNNEIEVLHKKLENINYKIWEPKRLDKFSISVYTLEYKNIQEQIDEALKYIETEQDKLDCIWNFIETEYKKWENMQSRIKWEKQQYEKDKEIDYNPLCAACIKNPHYIELIENKERIKKLEQEAKNIEISLKESIRSCNKLGMTISEEECLSKQYIYIDKYRKTQHKNITNLHNLYSKKKEYERIYKEYEFSINSIELHEKENKYKIICNNLDKLSLKLKEYEIYEKNRDTYLYINKLWNKWKINHKGTESYTELIQYKMNIEMQIKEVAKYRECIETNDNYKKEMICKEKQYQECLKEKEKQKIGLCLIEKELESIKEYKKQWEENKKEWKEKENMKEKLEILISCVDRNAIPSFLLQKNIQSVERRLNQMLSSFIEKKVIFKIEENDILFGLECHDENGKSICSTFMGGMEGFIVDICLKLCISYMACYPCCNIFFIDEGISVFDQEHMHNIKTLFDFLSQIRSHVFLISHLPSIQDFVDMSLEIYRSSLHSSHLLFL